MAAGGENTAARGSRALRRAAAIAFLSNISLDGSHPPLVPLSVDTGTLDVSGLVSDLLATESSARKQDVSDSGSNVVAEAVYPSDRQLTRSRRKTLSGDSTASDRQFGAHSRHYRRNSPSLSVLTTGFSHSSCESISNSVGSRKYGGSNISSARPVLSSAERVALAAPGTRLLLVSSHRHPLLTFSLLSHAALPRPTRSLRRDRQSRDRHDRVDSVCRRRLPSSGRPSMPAISDRSEQPGGTQTDTIILPPTEDQEVSYRHFLFPSASTGESCSIGEENMVSPPLPDHPRLHHPPSTHQVFHSPRRDGIDAGSNPKQGRRHVYHPYLLDNPELQSKTHRTLLSLKSFRCSIIEHMKPCDLKKMANEQFEDQFPDIRVTLSKLRSLKGEMRRIAVDSGVDLLTVAQSYIYLEKLVLSSHVHKLNRKLVSGACLLLSAKMTDVKGDMLSLLVERIESVFRVHRRELLSHELSALVELRFGLHVPEDEVEPHLRLLHSQLR